MEKQILTPEKHFGEEKKLGIFFFLPQKTSFGKKKKKKLEKIISRGKKKFMKKEMPLGNGVMCVIGDIQSIRGRHALIKNVFISPAGKI